MKRNKKEKYITSGHISPATPEELKKRDSKTEYWPILSFRDADDRTWITDIECQRGSVWKDEDKLKLMDSYLHGKHVNPIIANKIVDDKKKMEYFRIIDGKQRLETIRSFMNQDSVISLKFPFKIDKDTHWLSFNEIRSKFYSTPNPSKDLESLWQKLNEGVKMGVTIYENLTLEEERQEFNRQNRGKPLTNQEKLFCNHPRTKQFIEVIYNLYIPNEIKYVGINKNKKGKSITKDRINNDRYNAYQFLIMYPLRVFYGSGLMNKTINYSEDLMHDQTLFFDSIEEVIGKFEKTNPIEKYIKEDDRKKYFDDLFLKFEVNTITGETRTFISLVKELVEIYKLVAKIERLTKTTWLQTRILDMAFFIKYKMENKTETIKSIESNLELWKEIYTTFELKRTNPTDGETRTNPNGSCVSIQYSKNRKDWLEQSYNEVSKKYNNDTGKKNQPFPIKLKEFLFNSSEKYNWKCPYYPELELKEVNHYPPKCKSSNSYPIVLSEKANREFNAATEEKTTMTFEPMKKFYKKCYDDIKNEIPDEFKSILREYKE
jgi:hypothetical protein